MIEDNMDNPVLINADCLDAMRDMESNSVDSIVTDPPYGLSFMGKDWDSFGQDLRQPKDGEVFHGANNPYGRGKIRYGIGGSYGGKSIEVMCSFQEQMTPIFAEALRVAKPGAHLLAFGGTRTYHRLACAIEDAGWEIRDCIAWTYGCLSEDTEILTCNGWAKIGTICAGDKIYAYDRETKTFRCEAVKDTFLYDYDDTAYCIQSDKTNQLVSRNHRVIVERSGVEVFEYAENLAQEHEARVPILESLQGLLDEQGTQIIRSAWRTTTTVARITPVHYKGRMWCVSVPSGAIIAKRNGKIFITGNSGFPKSMDVSKAIDKALGAERKSSDGQGEHEGTINFGMKNRCPKCGKPYFSGNPCTCPREDKIPITEEAKKWQGWGTCLKPAFEPIVVARKPLEGTVANNILKYGTGGLNIDSCRVPTENESISNHSRSAEAAVSKGKYNDSIAQETHQTDGQKLGRFPANFVHDGSDEVVELFPESNGSGKARILHRNAKPNQQGWGMNKNASDEVLLLDGGTGSVARFFYCAKASKAERGEGNNHPTIKPLALMKWLVTLVTPPNGTVLDPFMGSGTTGVAARELNKKFIGVERDEHYFEIAKNRIMGGSEKESSSEDNSEEVGKPPEGFLF